MSINQEISTGDKITDLPVDEKNPTHTEIHMVDSVFGEPPTIMNNLVKEGKGVMIVGILFILSSLPPIDDCLHKLIPVTKKTPYLLIFFKALLVMVLYWVIKYYSLSRKA